VKGLDVFRENLRRIIFGEANQQGFGIGQSFPSPDENLFYPEASGQAAENAEVAESSVGEKMIFVTGLGTAGIFGSNA
jgi:hypothetical protein